MKRLSRLTALLLAMVLLLTSFAFAEGVKEEDLDAATWNEWTAAASEDDPWGLGGECGEENVYCQYVNALVNDYTTAQDRYDYMMELANDPDDVVALEFTMLHYFFNMDAHTAENVVCICNYPSFEPEYVPGDVSLHEEDCPWHFANLSLAEQYELVEAADEETAAEYTATLDEEALDTLSRVNVTEYTKGNVSVNVPEGSFSDDYLLEVEPVILNVDQLGLLFDTGSFDTISAFDISFAKLDDMSIELQPKEGNPVYLDFSGLNDGLHVVYHMYETEDGYEIEIVNLDNTIEGNVSTTAESFSIYIVTSTSSTSTNGTSVQDGGSYTITVGESVIFYWPGTYGWGYSYPDNFTWSVNDPDGTISYEITMSVRNGWQYEAPWIEISALKAGTNATVTIVSEDVTEETFTIVVNEQTGFHVENEVAENGCLVPVGFEDKTNVIYNWTRSDNVIVRADALNEDGSVNVSIDRGGVTNSRSPITYTVTAIEIDEDGTETTLASATYEVIYGQEILNPSFEKPEITRDGANQYFYNGYPGLYWKTTAPGSGSAGVTADIEMSEVPGTYGISTVADGDQFAELNAENFGALYQDILTTPGATFTWGFAHAARDDAKAVNDMYVVMAATKDAQDIQSKSQIDGLLDAIPNDASIPSSGTGYRLEYNNEVYYLWYHDANDNISEWENISGKYTVPEGQYLTRLFFASNTNGNNGGSTLGNLIDATSAYETLSYRIEYYIDMEIQTEDTVEAAARVYTYVEADKLTEYLSEYTLTGVTVNGQPYPDDITASDFDGFYVAPYHVESGEDDCYVVFRVYFRKEAITVTKRVEISNWTELNATKQLALMNGYKVTFGLYDENDTLISTVEVPVTYAEGQELIALGEFSTAMDGTTLKLEEGTYTIKEISAPELVGYALTTSYPDVDSGYPTITITGDKYTGNISCLNSYEYKKGALTITKNVSDVAYPADGMEFSFTVTPIEGQDISTWLDSNNYTASGDGFIVTMNVGATMTASITLPGIPAGAYEVVESVVERYNTTYQVGTAAVTSDKAEVNVTQNGAAEVVVTNTAKVSNLTISKTVTGNDARDPEFTFTVTLKNSDGTNFNGTLSDVVFTDGVATVTMKNGESVTIEGIPVGATYAVEETDLPTGYLVADVNATGNTGTIVLGGNTAAFTNVYTTGSLTIGKTVVGTDAPANDAFTFTVSLPVGTYSMKKGDAEATNLAVVNGTATITLKNGESVVISGIPVGATYNVKETANASYDTTVSKNGAAAAAEAANGTEGTIDADGETVAYTNTYKYASLTITKEGIQDIDNHEKNGDSEEEKQSSLFRVRGNGIDITVAICGNDSITIKQLPVGNYTVTELTNWSWRYEPLNDAAKTVEVKVDTANSITFNNDRDKANWLSGDNYNENSFNGYTGN